MVESSLPSFQYHPDPLATGSIGLSDQVCECCGKNRGYIYTGPYYSIGSESMFCPWCIHSGDAAKKFDGIFSDDLTLIECSLPDHIVDEVTRRTPGFNGWQQEMWMVCCNDACAFMGDASMDEVKKMSVDEFNDLLYTCQLRKDILQNMIDRYTFKGNPSIYKWQCLHCNKNRFQVDFT